MHRTSPSPGAYTHPGDVRYDDHRSYYECVVGAKPDSGFDVEAPGFVAFEHIDPNALDALFRGADDEGSFVSFPVDNYQVTVTGSGEITIWSDRARNIKLTPVVRFYERSTFKLVLSWS